MNDLIDKVEENSNKLKDTIKENAVLDDKNVGKVGAVVKSVAKGSISTSVSKSTYKVAIKVAIVLTIVICILAWAVIFFGFNPVITLLVSAVILIFIWYFAIKAAKKVVKEVTDISDMAVDTVVNTAADKISEKMK